MALFFFFFLKNSIPSIFGKYRTVKNCSKWPCGLSTINKKGMEKIPQQNSVFGHRAIFCSLPEGQQNAPRLPEIPI